MAVKIASLLNDQQFNSNGTLLSGGKIETFLAGSSTPATTFTTDAGTVAQPNPIILNTRGEVPNPIYLTTGVKYKLVLKDSNNNVLRTYDNIEGVNDSASTAEQWVSTSVAPVFINATQFSLAGDQTSNFQINRRVKLLVTAGTVYGYITASVFTTLTTVTVSLDSGVLDSGLSNVQLGFISPLNTSLFPISPSYLSVGAPSWTTAGEFNVTQPQRLGYGVGAGSTVTQATSKSTNVTLNKPTGQIVTNSAALAANTAVAFTLNNTLIAQTDIVDVAINTTSGSFTSYSVRAYPGAAGVIILLKNESAGSLAEILVINFNVFKGANS